MGRGLSETLVTEFKWMSISSRVDMYEVKKGRISMVSADIAKVRHLLKQIYRFFANRKL